MINFIIYENKNKWVQYYKEIIENLLKNTNIKYRLKVLTDLNKEKLIDLEGKKIYLLSYDNKEKNGLDIAYKIRENKDWLSPIIIISSLIKKNYFNKINILAFLIKNNNLNINLKESLKFALEITTGIKSFNFMYNNEYFQVPLNEIYFFEKSLNHNYINIITKNHSYKIRESITKLNNKFNTIPYFYKTHQSYIINIKKIKKIDFTNNIIYFDNNKFTLLSREKKKELKELLNKQTT